MHHLARWSLRVGSGALGVLVIAMGMPIFVWLALLAGVALLLSVCALVVLSWQQPAQTGQGRGVDVDEGRR